MADLTILQRFKMARTSFDESAQEVADEIGCSRQYLYECLKYPDKNRDIHSEALEYINSAGIEVPDHLNSKLATKQ